MLCFEKKKGLVGYCVWYQETLSGFFVFYCIGVSAAVFVFAEYMQDFSHEVLYVKILMQ